MCSLLKKKKIHIHICGPQIHIYTVSSENDINSRAVVVGLFTRLRNQVKYEFHYQTGFTSSKDALKSIYSYQIRCNEFPHSNHF